MSRVHGWAAAAMAAWALALLLATSQAQDVSAGDAARGKVVFEKRCTGCHSLTQNREGPKLGGVYGRVSGTVDGFAYSDALKKAKMTWDEKTLNQWLADPDALVPDNNMEFHVPKADERRDVIAFLKQVPLR